MVTGLLIGVLHLDHGIGALGQHGAGHDAHGGACLEGGWDRAGRDVSGHRQHDGRARGGTGCVRGPQRVAVHGRIRPGRDGQGRGDVLSQDQAVGLRQG